MNIPNKKLKSGFEMPVFGIGTWEMGGRMEYDPTNNDERDINAIRNAIEMGITHIDTAESYANGYAELLVGRAIKNLDRSKLFIASKVRPRNQHYQDIINSCTSSLERIGLDHFDLYMLHQPNPEISISETMSSLDYLIDEGLIKHIGVSNFSIERFEKAQDCTKNRIVANQLHLNLIFREPERRGLLEYCQKNDIMFVAWRPVQKGLLTERGHYPLLDEMCEKYDKTPVQIAINWLISQDNVTTLSKMSDPQHLDENLGALNWEMEKGDIERLRNEFPDQQDVSDAVPLSKYD